MVFHIEYVVEERLVAGVSEEAVEGGQTSPSSWRVVFLNERIPVLAHGAEDRLYQNYDNLWMGIKYVEQSIKW